LNKLDALNRLEEGLYNSQTDLALLLDVLYEIKFHRDYELFSLLPEITQRAVFGLIETYKQYGEFKTYNSNGEHDHSEVLSAVEPLYEKWTKSSGMLFSGIDVSRFEVELTSTIDKCVEALGVVGDAALAIVEYVFAYRDGYATSYFRLYTLAGIEASLNEAQKELDNRRARESTRVAIFEKRVIDIQLLDLKGLLEKNRNSYGVEYQTSKEHRSINLSWPVPVDKTVVETCNVIGNNIIKCRLSDFTGSWSCKGAELRIFGLNESNEKYDRYAICEQA